MIKYQRVYPPNAIRKRLIRVKKRLRFKKRLGAIKYRYGSIYMAGINDDELTSNDIIPPWPYSYHGFVRPLDIIINRLYYYN